MIINNKNVLSEKSDTLLGEQAIANKSVSRSRTTNREIKDESDQVSEALFAMSLRSNTDVSHFNYNVLDKNNDFSRLSDVKKVNEKLHDEFQSLFKSRRLTELNLLLKNSSFIDESSMSARSSLANIAGVDALQSIVGDREITEFQRNKYLNSIKVDVFMSLINRTLETPFPSLSKGNYSVSNLSNSLSETVRARDLLPSPQNLFSSIADSKMMSHTITKSVLSDGNDSIEVLPNITNSQWTVSLDSFLNNLAHASKTTNAATQWLQQYADDVRIVPMGNETHITIKLNSNVLDNGRLQLTLNGDSLQIDLLQSTSLLSKEALISLQAILEEKYPHWKFILSQRLDTPFENRVESSLSDSSDKNEDEEYNGSNNEQRKRQHRELYEEF